MRHTITPLGIIFTNLGYVVSFLFLTQVLHLAIPLISAILWVVFYNSYAVYQWYKNTTSNSVAK